MNIRTTRPPSRPTGPPTWRTGPRTAATATATRGTIAEAAEDVQGCGDSQHLPAGNQGEHGEDNHHYHGDVTGRNAHHRWDLHGLTLDADGVRKCIQRAATSSCGWHGPRLAAMNVGSRR
tara:strand:- start:154 stop:513 length:360 start_codon:yes stop_codon:yes gene_type:complete